EREVFKRERLLGKKKFRKLKIVGKREGCWKKGRLSEKGGEEKVIERSKGYWRKGSWLEEGRVVRRREGYQKEYYQR
ncbi:35800_t:CDS:1, partial [Gigaspora margarita]